MACELLPLHLDGLTALARDPDAFGAALRLAVAPHQELLRGVAAQTLALGERVGRREPWIGYLAVESGAVVGTCGFVGPPDAAGAVEIAYFTFPAFEGRGHATAMAAGLCAIAAASDEAKLVCALTLPQRNASARILEKLGFRQTGTAHDADAGPVWRWERPVDPGSRRPESA